MLEINLSQTGELLEFLTYRHVFSIFAVYVGNNICQLQ